MAKIGKYTAIADLGLLLRTLEIIANGAVGFADFTDAGVRALLLDMLQDEIDELRVKWGVKAGGNGGK